MSCSCGEECCGGSNAVKAVLTDELGLARMAEFFQCFADPTRLKIINALMLADLCVGDLCEAVGMSQPAVSHHLRNLRQLRLVRCRRDGKSMIYSIADQHIRLLFELCRTHIDEKSSEDDLL